MAERDRMVDAADRRDSAEGVNELRLGPNCPTCGTPLGEGNSPGCENCLSGVYGAGLVVIRGRADGKAERDPIAEFRHQAKICGGLGSSCVTVPTADVVAVAARLEMLEKKIAGNGAEHKRLADSVGRYLDAIGCEESGDLPTIVDDLAARAQLAQESGDEQPHGGGKDGG